MTYDVAIIGGGLAGSGAAIQLARRGLSVLLLEKQRYPVHKLCGEFLSPEVTSSFKRLGVLDALEDAGARPVRRVQVTTARGASFGQELPLPGLSLSRYALDELLFRRAADEGAEARDGTGVRDIQGSLADGFVIHTDEVTYEARAVLGAWGKRGLLDRKVGRDVGALSNPYVAFKAHYVGVSPGDAVELHAFSGGYCGLVQVEDGRTNACWIGHERVLQEAGGDPEAMIAQAFRQNDMLAARFDNLDRISDSFSAVSQVIVRPKSTFEGDVCMIGDTAGMIAPMCGDGMAMALRSAELATPRLHAFLGGHLSRSGFVHSYDAAWRRAFGSRMRLGRWMHYAYMNPLLAETGVRVCDRMPSAGRWVIENTRALPVA